jgi:uncharacterized protein
MVPWLLLPDKSHRPVRRITAAPVSERGTSRIVGTEHYEPFWAENSLDFGNLRFHGSDLCLFAQHGPRALFAVAEHDRPLRRIDAPHLAFYAHSMEFKISELEREPIDFDRQIKPGVIDYGEEAQQTGPLTTEGRAEVLHEHRGPKEIVADSRLKGHFAGRFEVPCARCVEPVAMPLEADFDLLFRPIGADAGPAERSISAPDTEIGYYQKDSLLLEDVLREQVLLSLPVRTLCKEDCKGLCPRCGSNRNSQTCSCDEGPSDPRWEALADLRERIKP